MPSATSHPETGGDVAEADAVEGGVFVLEGEVEVAGAMTLEVGDLAADEDIGEDLIALEEALDVGRGIQDGEDGGGMLLGHRAV